MLELHPWGSRTPRLDRPDRLIFDFDPDEAVAWKDLVTGVELLRTLLGELELEGFLKTTGGKGLHVVVPIRTTLDWAQAKGFTRAVADFMVTHLRRPLHGDRVEGAAQGQDPHRLPAQRRRRHRHCAVRRCARAQRAGLHADRVGGARDATSRFDHFNLRNAERAAWRSRNAIRGATSTTTKQTITKAHGKRVGFTL